MHLLPSVPLQSRVKAGLLYLFVHTSSCPPELAPEAIVLLFESAPLLESTSIDMRVRNAAVANT